MPSLASIGAVPLSEMREELRHAARGIPLHKRDGTIRAFAIVDADDYPELSCHRWYLNLVPEPYVRRHVYGEGRRRCLHMQRVILGLEQGDRREADHINRDPLDNRKSNLRIVAGAQNKQNKSAYRGGTSKHRGVSRHRDGRRWVAQAQLDGRKVYLGLFDDEEEAAKAITAWRLEHMPFSNN